MPSKPKASNLRLVSTSTSSADPLSMSALDAHLGYKLRRAQTRLFADFHKAVADLGLTPAQYSVLLLIDQNPARKPSEFADALGIQRPNFASLIDGLEDRGLVMRLPLEGDRRSHTLGLTKDGLVTLARAVDRVAQHNARISQQLSPTELATFVTLVDKIAR
jgi:DNA-binding MarR family transcriptional regulator